MRLFESIPASASEPMDVAAARAADDGPRLGRGGFIAI